MNATPSAPDQREAPAPTPPVEKLPKRAWTARCGPAAVVSALLAAASGYLLAGVVASRVSPTTRLWPRRWFADALAQHSWDSRWALGVGAGLALAGLALLALAALPGRHGLLAIRPAPAGPAPVAVGGERVAAPVGVFATRRALAWLLADEARAARGVESASARVRRGAVRVRAGQRFGSGPGVEEELTEALRARLGAFGLDRPPRLRVRLIPGTRR